MTVRQIRRVYADGRDTPWLGGAVASWWESYARELVDADAWPSYRAPIVALHLRFDNGQLVTLRPRRPS